MKKKSLISMIAALSLTATIMVGATLAYLTAQTEEVVNTFTIGNVDITLTEPEWNPEDAQNLQPGAEVAKDPTVTNVGANDAFIAVTVDGMTEMTAAGFSAEVNAGWTKMNADGTVDDTWDGKTLVDGIYAYDTVVATGAATDSVFDKVVFGKDITGEAPSEKYVINAVPNDPKDESKGVHYVIEGIEGKTFATEEEAKLYINTQMTTETGSFDLIIKAFAIQAEGFNAANYDWVKEIDFSK